MIVFIVYFIMFITLIFLLAKLRIYDEFDWKINLSIAAIGAIFLGSLTEPTGKPVRFCWRDSSTCVHRIVAHRLWQAHLLRSSRYGHAARRPQLSSKMLDRPYSQNTVYPVF